MGNLVEQLWNFAWPAAVAGLHPSLLPVAVLGFFAKVNKRKLFWFLWTMETSHDNTLYLQLSIFIWAPMVGSLMDNFPRIPAYNSLNFVQVCKNTHLNPFVLRILVSFGYLLVIHWTSSDSCSIIICGYDCTCSQYSTSYLCISCAYPALVYCTGDSWGTGKSCRVSFGGYHGARLGSAGNIYAPVHF